MRSCGPNSIQFASVHNFDITSLTRGGSLATLWDKRQSALPCGPWLSSPQPRDSLRFSSRQAPQSVSAWGHDPAQHTRLNKP
jgi:hypothetical protein